MEQSVKLGTPNLRRHEFGDPAKAYERDEAGTCAGCVHGIVLLFGASDLAGGVNGVCDARKHYGRKCSLYRVREAVARTDGDG